MFKQALEFAAIKHNGQKRKNGNPYIIHPIRVSQELVTEKEKVVAILHDVLEDTDTKEHELAHFGKDIVETVKTLTHIEGESYGDYIARVKKNKLAKAVKIVDMADNLSDSPSESAIIKYAHALDELLK